ncbi:hypothetical protein QWZ06_02590 [Chryseobacterium tructae]|uniref:Uncharacterized protein n=1 Tax=Chryseobacterium tructae TaxID=1037380 RepID=A0ABV7XSA5_9FLAO|nr:hypothetical protein [Chryseobacterium tructae]MDN3691222.1 hypothetical protein [Chryseobacterium tructae]
MLLSTVGRLNARIISSTISTSELHHIDINDSDLYLLSDIFSQELISPVGCRTYHHKKLNDDFQYTIFNHTLSGSISNQNTLFSMNKVKIITFWDKWRLLDLVDGISIMTTISNTLKKFSINSFKLVDGFKFIIKIPDKHNIIS